MMFLGIYLHVVVGYTGDGRWPYIDPHPTHGINITLGVIHSFRMPAFYVMAGFFGALLWTAGAWRHLSPTARAGFCCRLPCSGR